MLQVIDGFNQVCVMAFSVIFGPLRGVPPIWPLLVVSFLTGLLMLRIFGTVSNQQAIGLIKDRIKGNLIALRLFRDDPGLILRIQARIMRDTLVYIRYSLWPLFIMIGPVLIVMIQLNHHLGTQPLKPREQTVFKVHVKNPRVLEAPIDLIVPEGLTAETPPVRIAGLNEIAWRIRADAEGEYVVNVRVGDETIEKKVVVGDGWRPLSCIRTGRSAVDLLLYPGESPIQSPVVDSVVIRYQPLPIAVFGWQLHWMVLFFVLSISSGFAFRNLLGVNI